MQTKLIFAALAGSVLSGNILPRQTDAAAASACLSIGKTIPTPPPALVSELAKNPSVQKDYCHLTVPGSVSKDYSSYISELSVWFDKNEHLLTVCPQYSNIQAQGPINCKTSMPSSNGSPTTASGSGNGNTDTASAKATRSSKAAGSSGSGGTGTASTQATSSSKAAAPRETGMAMGAIIAAAFALAAS